MAREDEKVSITSVANVPTISKVAIPLVAENVLPAAPRGAEILVKGLIKNGVDTVFGLPGGAILSIQTLASMADERRTRQNIFRN